MDTSKMSTASPIIQLGSILYMAEIRKCQLRWNNKLEFQQLYILLHQE